LEGKKTLLRVSKTGNAHIFEPVLARSAAFADWLTISCGFSVAERSQSWRS
jgi:hypothetical protein